MFLKIFELTVGWTSHCQDVRRVAALCSGYMIDEGFRAMSMVKSQVKLFLIAGKFCCRHYQALVLRRKVELAAMSKEGGRVLSGNGKLSKFELIWKKLF